MRAGIDLSQRALQDITPNNQSESQSTVSSSMETVPADLIDGSFSEPEQGQGEVWARLFPLSPSFDNFDMKEDNYTFGRGDECDYQFKIGSGLVGVTSLFHAYSKTHFIIKREETSAGTFAFLEDKSSNGTFINKEKVGKGNVQALKNNDEISLSTESNRAFIFMDSTSELKSLPKELKDKYVMARELGTGAYGVVNLAFEKGTGKGVAIKCIKKTLVGGSENHDMSSLIKREIQILKSLQHPCIVSVLDVIDGEEKFFIVLELVEGGELFDRVIEVKQFTEYEARVLFYQICHAMKYLHDQNIAHRDLKCENILLCSKKSNETRIKVNDFGVSKFIDAQTKLKTFCGTENYIAPEILSSAGMKAYTNAVDVWSLGVMLYVMLVGYMPFNSKDDDDKGEFYRSILDGKYDFPKKYWKNISKEAISLIKAMLTVSPEKRITIGEVLVHPWFVEDKKAVEKAKSLMYSELNGPTDSKDKKRKRTDVELEDTNDAGGPSKKSL